MNEPKKKYKKKKKSKKIGSCKKNTNNKSNNEKSSSCNDSNNKSNNTNKTSKLCSFSSVDYIVLASTLAIALGEELSSDDINILASFFAVLSDELALIAAVDACNTGGNETSIFVPPIPDVAATSSQNISKNIKKKK